MNGRADIVLFGTGSFAARILFDLAATVRDALAIAVVGRDAARLAWLRTGANARAAMFSTGIRVAEHRLESFSTEAVAELIARLGPKVVANTASEQGGRQVTDRPDGWTLLVREAGLGMTAALQAKISVDIARAVAASPGVRFVNCCYPDVVNPMLAAAGLPITSGIGNVAILAHAFAGVLGPGHPRIRMLAQHAALAAFRGPAEERQGQAPLRLWLGEEEATDVFTRFAAVKLAPEPVVDISGASGVPLFVALATGREWAGHAPGPNGLPGGYPVRFDGAELRLDLPPGLGAAAAVAWNAAFEERNGVVVGADRRVRYTGRVESVFRQISPEVAAGFSMADFEAAYRAVADLRTRQRARP